MPSAGRSILGLDINPEYICIAEMGGSWPGGHNARIDAVKTPPGVFASGQLTGIDSAADAVRLLLSRMNVLTRDVVVGVPAQSTVTRTVAIPRVPDNEIRTVIQGELEHYQILRSDTGSFDYARIGSQSADATELQMLLMAADDAVLAPLRTVAERSGLHLIAMEPVTLAILRAVHSQAAPMGLAAVVTLSYGESEVLVLSNGAVQLYRRLDIGNESLIRRPDDASPSGPARRTLIGEPDDAVESVLETTLNVQTANSLTLEVQRTLDYFFRENPHEGQLQNVIVATNQPDLAPMAEWLGRTSGVDAVVGALPFGALPGRSYSPELDGAGAIRCIGAAGLAMRELAGHPSTVPRFDFATRNRDAVKLKEAHRKFLASALISTAILILGGAAAFSLNVQANNLQQALEQKQKQLKIVEETRRVKIEQVEAQVTLYRTLRAFGFPFERIMDVVTANLPANTGLTEVDLDIAGKLTVMGEAPDTDTVNSFRSHLAFAPNMMNTVVNKFARVPVPNTHMQLVKFEVGAQVVPPPHP